MLVGASLNPLKLLLCVGVLVCVRGCHGQATNRSGKRARLGHKVHKLSELMFRGNDQERETARQRLDELLTKNRMTWGDVSRLIALSRSNPETTRNDSEGEDEPPASPDHKVPNLFELAEWTLRRFLFLEEHQLTAATLWVLRCFVFRDFQHTPRLALLSPTRGCGKSVMVNQWAAVIRGSRRRAHLAEQEQIADLNLLSADRAKPLAPACRIVHPQTPNGAASSPGVALGRRVPAQGDHRVFLAVH